jgi:hypothetical protein
MALISEWMEQCGKKVLDNAGIVREACSRQLTSARVGVKLVLHKFLSSYDVVSNSVSDQFGIAAHPE